MSHEGMTAPTPLKVATAWWIAAELQRRHPSELTVIETHPGGGQYDCLSVYRTDGDEPQVLVHMNHQPGNTHLEGPGQFWWPDAILSQDRRREVVERYESAVGLQAPSTTPVAQPSSVAVRAIAAFMERVCLAVHVRWILENGVLDTSGYEGGIRRDHFRHLPMAQQHLETLTDTHSPLKLKEYRFWFLLPIQDNKPILAIDQVSGLAWSQGREFDLLRTYKELDRSMDRLVSAVFPAAF